MEIPVGSIVVRASMRLDHAVARFLYQVVKETDKSVEVTRLDEMGKVIDSTNTDTIRKSSVIAILNNIDEFKPFEKMNAEIQEKYHEYNNLYSRYQKELDQIKNKLGKPK